MPWTQQEVFPARNLTPDRLLKKTSDPDISIEAQSRMGWSKAKSLLLPRRLRTKADSLEWHRPRVLQQPEKSRCLGQNLLFAVTNHQEYQDAETCWLLALREQDPQSPPSSSRATRMFRPWRPSIWAFSFSNNGD